MGKVIIRESKDADTRTMQGFNPETIEVATKRHIQDVQAVGKIISKRFEEQTKEHDWTKREYFEEFIDCMEKTVVENENFVELYWYKGHVTTEKHHSDTHLHLDYSLLDLMEELIDKVVAIKGRVGKIDSTKIAGMISQEAKDLAVQNFIKIIDDMTETEIE